jgi:Uma2 family endonuclease
MLAELPESAQPLELRVCERLNRFVTQRQLGEVFISLLDVVLSPRRVVQPDVLFVSHDRRHIVKDHIRGVPDLAFEIISQGTWQRDRVSKKSPYEQFGLAEYWIVDPESRTIEVFALEGGAYVLHSRGQGEECARSRLLKGFELTFSELEK